MREVRKGYSFCDAPSEQSVDPKGLAGCEDARVHARTTGMRELCDEEHQFRRFVASIGGAMTEIYPRPAQRPLAAFDGLADAHLG
jgi:hypothetical protein